MSYTSKKSVVLIACVFIFSACSTAPTREQLLQEKVIYSRSSDKDYLEIANCLKSKAGFNLPEWNSRNWRDINTFFIYHESTEINGYPQFHDESTKTYYITEIHDPKYLRDTNKPITHGNGNWIMAIKDVSSSKNHRSEIEVRSNKEILNDASSPYSADNNALLSQYLYKAEEIDHCF